MTLFDKAESCRSRAVELRAVAGCTSEPEARTTLLAVAHMLDEHARTLEAMAVKFRSGSRGVIREAAD